jgi:hypothetical protein
MSAMQGGVTGTGGTKPDKTTRQTTSTSKFATFGRYKSGLSIPGSKTKKLNAEIKINKMKSMFEAIDSAVQELKIPNDILSKFEGEENNTEKTALETALTGLKSAIKEIITEFKKEIEKPENSSKPKKCTDKFMKQLTKALQGTSTEIRQFGTKTHEFEKLGMDAFITGDFGNILLNKANKTVFGQIGNSIKELIELNVGRTKSRRGYITGHHNAYSKEGDKTQTVVDFTDKKAIDFRSAEKKDEEYGLNAWHTYFADMATLSRLKTENNTFEPISEGAYKAERAQTVYSTRASTMQIDGIDANNMQHYNTHITHQNKLRPIFEKIEALEAQFKATPKKEDEINENFEAILKDIKTLATDNPDDSNLKELLTDTLELLKIQDIDNIDIDNTDIDNIDIDNTDIAATKNKLDTKIATQTVIGATTETEETTDSKISTEEINRIQDDVIMNAAIALTNASAETATLADSIKYLKSSTALTTPGTQTDTDLTDHYKTKEFKENKTILKDLYNTKRNTSRLFDHTRTRLTYGTPSHKTPHMKKLLLVEGY